MVSTDIFFWFEYLLPCMCSLPWFCQQPNFLIISDGPDIDGFTVMPPIGSIFESNLTTITCDVDAKPHASIQLIGPNAEVLTKVSSGSQLRYSIQHINRSHSGSYLCSAASTETGKMDELMIQINVECKWRSFLFWRCLLVAVFQNDLQCMPLVYGQLLVLKIREIVPFCDLGGAMINSHAEYDYGIPDCKWIRLETIVYASAIEAVFVC